MIRNTSEEHAITNSTSYIYMKIFIVPKAKSKTKQLVRKSFSSEEATENVLTIDCC